MRTLTTLTGIAVVGVFVAAWLMAGDGTDSVPPPVDADVERARVLQPLAEKGQADAAYELGQLFETGRGVAADPAAAARLYRRAADQGHAAAQFRLGRLFETGQGGVRDPETAARWYALAAKLGRNADAQFALGNLYFQGRGVANDLAEALAWYRRAANRGHGGAQYVLGTMHADGWGVRRDLVAAYMWLTLAIQRAEQVSVAHAAFDPVEARRQLVTQMNDFQIERGEARARAWRPTR